MRLFVRGVMIGLVASTPNGFRLDLETFSRYLMATIEEVGHVLHELEAEGILQYEQEDSNIYVWAFSYTEDIVAQRIGFRRDALAGEG